MNLNSVKVPKMSGGGATSALIKFGVIVGLSVYGVANSLYNVEGGHRAIVFNRIGGVKNKESGWVRKDLEIEDTSPPRREDETKTQVGKVKKKKKVKAEKHGVCHVSRVPPRMDHVKLRQVLSQFGEIQRIYLVPEAAAAQMNRKRASGFRGQAFSEGWVEFTKKSVAKRVANMLNGQQMGGRKRSSFYYDIWNVKYLSKIKWDDVTDEIAQRHAVREQKLALELSAAKRERDFYLTQVDKSRALSSIEERMKKKQKVQQKSGVVSDFPSDQFAPKVIRQFPQKKPVADQAGKLKPSLSKDVLAGVFGGQ